MREQKTNGTGPAGPQVVGTIYSAGSLKRALRLAPGAVDLLEVRVDHFAEDPASLLKAAPKLPAPLIITVRHRKEGGAAELGGKQREHLYAEFLPLATYVDIEVRSISRLEGILASARAAHVGVIISDHHFQKTPSARVLEERLQLARAAGAAIIKVAARLESAAELTRLVKLFEAQAGVPLSLMGMGPLGKVSRLLFARLGSVLNYGYLDEPQVPGQWEATLLKKRLAELAEE
jgi:3-dehydroquinate dehydratase I